MPRACCMSRVMAWQIAWCAICRRCCGQATCWWSTTRGSSRLNSLHGAARRASASRWTSRALTAPGMHWHATRGRLHVGDELRFDGCDQLRATVMERDADGGVVLAFNQHDAEFAAALQRAGALALPPYIARPAGPLPEDRRDYQTIFAAHDGAVAAPTAGLHFTPALLQALEQAWRAAASRSRCMSGPAPSCRCARMTSRSTTCMPNAARSRRRPPLRSTPPERRARGRGGHHQPPPAGKCRIGRRMRPAIRRRHDVVHRPRLPISRSRSAADQLPSPRSTLFMLVCAFAGAERMRAAYAHAIDAGYRFYSYGDACLLDGGGCGTAVAPWPIPLPQGEGENPCKCPSPIASPPRTAPRVPACCAPRMATCRHQPSCRSAPPAQ